MRCEVSALPHQAEAHCLSAFRDFRELREKVGTSIAHKKAQGAAQADARRLSSLAAPYSISAAFQYTSTVRTFIVPPGVTQIQVDACGGQGGGYRGITGGLGGFISAIIPVIPSTLFIYVGRCLQRGGI